MSDSADRTWDGLEIAADHPTGVSVCVRRKDLRHGAAGACEVLLLHRAHHGPDYQGDWAWTSPAGCRLPGEPVYAAVRRELAEEAGVEGVAPWAVDLSGRWATFALDLPTEAPITLVDPEHDRFEWAPPDVLSSRVLPTQVAEQQTRAAAVPAVDLAFRPMEATDFGKVAQWQSAPHVASWWDSRSRDEQSVRERYLPRLRGDEPTRMWVVEIDGAPAGFLQDYRVRDHPDYAVRTQDLDAIAFDYAIGEPGLIGRGLGTRLVWEFCRDVLRRDHPEAAHFLASPSHRNAASLRVLAKCGFSQGRWIDDLGRPGEPPDTEIVCTFDVAHWLG